MLETYSIDATEACRAFMASSMDAAASSSSPEGAGWMDGEEEEDGGAGVEAAGSGVTAAFLAASAMQYSVAFL